ncbi:30S ribosome-binding factor RbfA [candidate division KSB1 bacterium]|nr:30S ribosome-binding factor RbfA [candidate division KSB1 bacterium]
MSKRIDRVSEMLKREISRILVQEIKDPGIKFVTITCVKLSPDLKSSKIYYTLLDDVSHRPAMQKKLDGACGYIRTEIGKNLKLRYTPEIRFYYDTVADYAQHVESLIVQIKEGDNE